MTTSRPPPAVCSENMPRNLPHPLHVLLARDCHSSHHDATAAALLFKACTSAALHLCDQPVLPCWVHAHKGEVSVLGKKVPSTPDAHLLFASLGDSCSDQTPMHICAVPAAVWAVTPWECQQAGSRSSCRFGADHTGHMTRQNPRDEVTDCIGTYIPGCRADSTGDELPCSPILHSCQRLHVPQHQHAVCWHTEGPCGVAECVGKRVPGPTAQVAGWPPARSFDCTVCHALGRACWTYSRHWASPSGNT
jgi:hypothetical protein